MVSKIVSFSSCLDSKFFFLETGLCGIKFILAHGGLEKCYVLETNIHVCMVTSYCVRKYLADKCLYVGMM